MAGADATCPAVFSVSLRWLEMARPARPSSPPPLRPPPICWVNEEEHLRVISFNEGADVKGCFARISEAPRSAQQSSRTSGHDDMCSDSLGYLSTSPSIIGTGLRVSVLCL